MKISDEMVEQVAMWLWQSHDIVERGAWRSESWMNLDADKKARWIAHVRMQIEAVAPMILEEAAVWHDEEAARFSCGGQVESERADLHERDAAAIRAMGERG